MPHRAVFLDRDGVLIRTNVIDGKPYAIRTLGELELLPGVQSSVDELKNTGYKIVVVTNQPDIENGLVTADIVEAMHQKLHDLLPIDAIYYCPHNKDKNCNCRKPAIGMFLQAEKELNLDLKSSWMIGDRQSDVVSGSNAGCRTAFIDCNYKEQAPHIQDVTVHSLVEATEFILTKDKYEKLK